ncbi:hypothetical protein [Mucilaginibacter sp. SG564]|uniref:hypothetical protein n=1 Tax=unclassified Mucilaginibacter TaxID=2617802 RepID=UPI001557A171|nr:hypothetical protein [Mucilaginibacter sp. SG564]NOW95120.1 hypothetical protein [Mucilaginibacter sp. SG564]
MNKLLSLLSIALLLPIAGYSQFKVGKTKEEAKIEKGKKTPKLIGSKSTGLIMDFGLYSIEAEEIEYLSYATMKTTGITFEPIINFSSLKEEADFYKYILGLYDSYKDNEITLNKCKIVPRKKNLFGMNNLIFDIYPSAENDENKLTTYMIGKSGWINLFKNSKVHTLD